MTFIWILVAIAWIVGAVIAYGKFNKDKFDNPVWFAIFWPCVLILWPIWKKTHK